MKNEEKIIINWRYEGKTNLALGTGANKIETILGSLSCFVIPCFLLFLFFNNHLSWNYIQLAIGLIVAFDIGGGMICNSLNSCKRFYHSNNINNEGNKETILKNPLIFSVLHIHSIIIWSFFDLNNWIYGVVWYILLMIAVGLVIWVPLYVKRPISMLLILIAIMINLYVITPVTGFEWLIPVLFIKVVYGHLVREEPYRPENEG